MDETTKRVQEMYSQFPYPNLQGNVSSLRWGYDLDFILAQAGSTKRIDQIRVLDAGCGTGELLACCASVFPQAHFTGIELSPKSLEIAKKNAAHVEAINIEFYQKDIMDVTAELGSFDVIICSGVIHHLSQPEKGVNCLAKLLEPGGIMILYLYCQYTRARNVRIKQAVNILERDQSQFRKRIKIARALLNDYQLRDIALVDAYLHVNENLYTARIIFDLLRRCDLRFLRFCDEPMWNVENLIKDKEVVKMIQALSDDLRYEVLDLIISQAINRNSYEIFACHDSYEYRTVKELGKGSLNLYPMRTPFIRVEKDTANDNIYNLYVLHDSNNPLRLQLSVGSVNLIMRCDGSRTLGQILEQTVDEPNINTTHQPAMNELLKLFNFALNTDLIVARPVPSGKVWENIKTVDFSKA